ncbi:E3 ubiquitin-protein ligase HECTD2 [Entomortierella parvispora]|uniref:HECT-type E3 ubiquitin transferase n=1 Tax=Entomortierella parvispora TaxID=205924 RepID=A0A9P3HB90_9FUNG|nr:E3 ubiquitin-protein ligase HECTD2 [Entomortierella parvispora]
MTSQQGYSPYSYLQQGTQHAPPPRPSSASSSSTNDPQGSHLIIGKCMYCKSQLCYPQAVKVFQCVTCDTINDLIAAPGIVPQEPLTLQQIEREIERAKDRQAETGGDLDYSDLEALLREKLKKFAAFNASFSNRRPLTYDECGVNLADARKAFALLLAMPNSIALAVMTSVDGILKRPGKEIKDKEDLKFIMLMLECPWLSRHRTPQESDYHHNITKRLFTIMSNLPSELHKYLSSWFTNCLSTPIFHTRVNFVNKFITQRLSNQQKSSDRNQHIIYQSDARIQAAARVMHLFFKANQPNEKDAEIGTKNRAGSDYVIVPFSNNSATKSQRIPIDEYYNMIVDLIDLPVDFCAWESRSAMFTFCQYPFLISMGAKMQIMAWDAKRSMEIQMQKTIEALVMQKRLKAASENGGELNGITLLTQAELQQAPLLTLKVHRNNLIEESLTQLSRHEIDLKKSLRIEFIGEDGVDAGGLRKEWFLLLVRQLFDPQYGMFIYDDQSNYCWFNPASFESLDQFYLVGVVIGLAIYNSTILDLPLPLAVYKKLLNTPVTLEDLATFRPDLAKGFDQLLNYEDEDNSIEDVFCLNFVGVYEAYGESREVPLIPGGEDIPVTSENRRHYVERYANFIMNLSIFDQFESFRRGFYLVCSGHALSLFRPEEIDFLVRGSAEPLDIDQLRSVTVYEGFNDEHEVIKNFWSIFKEFEDKNQRRLLQFITASDRYPATGIANLAFKITCMGSHDSNRYPTTHTCFNQLCLYNYKGREKLKNMLMRAMNESEGFGVK